MTGQKEVGESETGDDAVGKVLEVPLADDRQQHETIPADHPDGRENQQKENPVEGLLLDRRRRMSEIPTSVSGVVTVVCPIDGRSERSSSSH